MTTITNDFTWRVGGQQGEGIDSTADIFAKAVARLGLHIHTYRSFSSRIRGGLTYSDVRIHETPIRARGDSVEVVVALGDEVVQESLPEISPGGVILYDSDSFTPDLPKTLVGIGVPLTKIAEENGNKIMRNMVALGATSEILGMGVEIFYEFVEERFGSKGPKVVEMNRRAILSGAQHVRSSSFERRFLLSPRPLPGGKRRLVINGNEATSFGALVAGCRFVSAYPITPATDLMEWMIDHIDEYGGFVLQAEDEIAAIHSVLGAFYAGVRAMTSTSGPGLSLMTEAVGLAGSAEIPAVVVDVMRPGPSTGLPTKHSQGDLLFVIHAGHDEFPRVVVSPSTTEEAFTLIQHAFNTAEIYQLPVFFLMDQDLGISYHSIEGLDVHAESVRRGRLVRTPPASFERYAITKDGVSPRAIPGVPGALFNSSGSEHSPLGFVTENRENRRKMVVKRAEKLRTYMKAIGLEEGEVDEELVPSRTFRPYHLLGDSEGRLGVITWGSSRGPTEEALSRLRREGVRFRLLVLTQLWPFPRRVVSEFLDSVEKVVVVETNYSGQLSSLIQMEVGGHSKIRRVTKWDGTPFRPLEVERGIREVM